MLLSKKLALGGVTSALILVFISLSFISPTADFALYALTSVCIAITVVIADLKTAIMTYIAASILIFVFYDILYFIPFFVLFGIYPILKSLAETRMNRVISVILKAGYFIIISIGFVLVFSNLVLSSGPVGYISSKFEISEVFIRVIATLACFLVLSVYDYALTIAITLISKRLSGLFNKNKS